MTANHNRFYYVDSLRAIAIFLVVGIHTLGYVQLEGDQYAIIGFIVHTAAVPIFFLCDGFLFANSELSTNRQFIYRKYIYTSAKRLLVPWVTFSLVYTIMRLGFEAIGLLKLNLVYGKSFWQVVKSIYASNIAQQMYFLLALFLIRGLSILTRSLLGVPLILLFGVIIGYTTLFYLAEDTLKPIFAEGLDPVLHGMWGLQYYLAGFIIARMHKSIETHAKLLAIGAFAMLILLRLSFDYTTLVRVVVIYLCIMGFYCASLTYTNTKNALSTIGLQTMGIYLLHAPILLKLVSLGVCHVAGNNLLAYLVVLVCTFFVSYGLSILISRMKSMHFLFGIFEKHKK